MGAVVIGTTLAERMLTRYHTVWGENIAHAYEADFQY
jgi:gamma-glutamylcysteine synthetase